jgi:CHAT domain
MNEPWRVRRIAVVSAQPITDAMSPTFVLRTDLETRTIQEAFGWRSDVEVFPVPASRTRDLIEVLANKRPDCLHIAGHGSIAGMLLETSDIHADEAVLSSDALRRLIRGAGGSVQLLVLSSCYSSTTAASCASDVNDVVGTSDELPDDAAIHFADGFYRGLAAGRAICDSFDLGVGSAMVESGIDSSLFSHECTRNPSERQSSGNGGHYTINEIATIFGLDPLDAVRALRNHGNGQPGVSKFSISQAAVILCRRPLTQYHLPSS